MAVRLSKSSVRKELPARHAAPPWRWPVGRMELRTKHMGQGRPNTPILLDWATISYRSIMRGVVYLVLLLAMGGVFYYLRAARRTTPEELALQEINRAERMYREAQASADASYARVIQSAGKILDSARLSYERKDFGEARAAAQQSQSFSQKILEGSSGE